MDEHTDKEEVRRFADQGDDWSWNLDPALVADRADAEGSAVSAPGERGAA